MPSSATILGVPIESATRGLRMRSQSINDWTEPILHIDMDAFFVEVERLDDPTLRDRPVLVGGGGPRGVVASASYEARASGAHSAMPMGAALRAVPKATVVPPRHRRYAEASRQVFAIFERFTPQVEALSVDEAFLDVTSLRLLHASPVDAAQAIRATIRRELGLPASAGVASNKLIAKLASEKAKPDGLLHVPSDRQLEFLHGLPVDDLWGVGQATRAALERFGVETVGDLAAVPEATLIKSIGPSHGRSLTLLAAGIDNRPVQPHGAAKSVSVEETYDEDISDTAEIRRRLLILAERLADRLHGAGRAGRTLQLKVRFADFTTITRSLTLAAPTDVGRDLFRGAVQLLERVAIPPDGIRLLGVGVVSMEPGDAPRQLSADRPAGWDDVASAIDKVRRKFGPDSVGPAGIHHDP